MKKNLLFIIPSLCAGGAEKSLVNLLNQIDFDLYNVDLFLFNHEGIFMEFLPSSVQILAIQDNYQLFSLPLHNSLKNFILKRDIYLFSNRLLYTLKNRTNKSISKREQYSWRYLSKFLNKLDKEYDVAIGFLEKTSIYFCVDKVKAKKKIGFIHNDYDKLDLDSNFDITYFKELDSIVTVSPECLETLKSIFLSEVNKMHVIYNIVSPTMINRMANQEITNLYNKKDDEIVILSIGRLSYQKGFELAIHSCKSLMNLGYKIKWYIIGEGDEREKLTNLIMKNKLDDNFKLLGLKSNPYPYIKQADIYVQTSRFEGKSIAIDEAKILNKPIVTTNYSTAKDQINNGIDGLIVDMTVEGITNGIIRIIEDKKIKKNLTNNLSKLNLGTEGEIYKLYELFK